MFTCLQGIHLMWQHKNKGMRSLIRCLSEQLGIGKKITNKNKCTVEKNQSIILKRKPA